MRVDLVKALAIDNTQTGYSSASLQYPHVKLSQVEMPGRVGIGENRTYKLLVKHHQTLKFPNNVKDRGRASRLYSPDSSQVEI